MSNFTTKAPTIFKAFPEVIAGITLRSGHQPAHHDANFGYKSLRNAVPTQEYVALKKEAYISRHALSALISPAATAHFAHQTHGNVVVNADEGDIWGSIEGDALVGRLPGQLTGVFLADCAGILLYDPVAKTYAAIHSGWRGTRAEIVPKTIQRLQAMGTLPVNIHAYISPVACPVHYQVGPEFRDYFAAEFLPVINDHLGFDNQAAITAQLQAAGVAHIEVDPTCTVENAQLHSYRRDGQLAGRFAAFIGLSS